MGQVIGEKLRSRYLKCRFTFTGAKVTDVAKTYPDGLLRFILWTPIQDVTATLADIAAKSDINYMFDYNQVKIIKDIKILLGNSVFAAGVAVPYNKEIVITIPWPRNMKLRYSGAGAIWTIDEQKDRVYMSAQVASNDAHFTSNVRMTYIDN